METKLVRIAEISATSKELKERMEKFGLELESSKSRLIEFGRFAEQNRRARGECKPETFDFLGFTIIEIDQCEK